MLSKTNCEWIINSLLLSYFISLNIYHYSNIQRTHLKFIAILEHVKDRGTISIIRDLRHGYWDWKGPCHKVYQYQVTIMKKQNY